MERLLQVLSLAIDLLDPADAILDSAKFQYVLPIDRPADQVQRQTGQSMVPELGERSKDWAMLLDGQSKQLKSTFQVEYGIVGASEVMARLNRRVGRVSREGMNSLAGTFGHLTSIQPSLQRAVDDFDMPASGLFLDWLWQFGKNLPDPGASQNVGEIVRAAERESEEDSNRIFKRLALEEVDINMTGDGR
jgi:hypothetical protein